MFKIDLFVCSVAALYFVTKCEAAYYLPGVTPVPFNQGDTVSLIVTTPWLT